MLAIGEAVVLNRKFWAANMKTVTALPGPGKFCKLIADELRVPANLGQRNALHKAVANSPWASQIETYRGTLEDRCSEASDSTQGAFWALSKGDPATTNAAAGILRRQYGIHEQHALLLAAHD